EGREGTTNGIWVEGEEVGYRRGGTGAGWGEGHEVGRSYTQPGYYWDGKIDALRIHRRARAAAEILAEFKADPRSNTEPLQARPSGDMAGSDPLDPGTLPELRDARGLPPPAPGDARI